MILKMTPRNIAYAIFKRWKVMENFFIFIVILAAIYLYVTPWRYESDATVVVKIGEQAITDPNLAAQPGQTPQPIYGDLLRQIVNSHVSILKSNDVTLATLKKLGVEKMYPSLAASPPRFFGTVLDAANERLRDRDLDVAVDRDSNTLEISLLNENPRVAQEALYTLIGFFKDKQADVMRNAHQNFLQQQVDMSLKRVDDTQQALLKFKTQNNITSLDDEKSLLLKQRDLLEQDLAAENTQTLDPAVADASSRLAVAEQHYLQASQTYAKGSPLLTDARDTLDLAQRQYSRIMGVLASSQHPGASGEPAIVSGWKAQLASVNSRLDHLNEAEGPLDKLQRQLQLAQQDYDDYVKRTEEARVTENLNLEHLTSLGISEEPTLPFKPARPRIFLIVGLAVVVGLVGGLALVFVLETLDETFGLPEQIEPVVGLPVIAVVNRDRRIRRLTRRRAT